MGTAAGGGAPPTATPEATKATRRTRLIFGGFICAVGLAIEIIVLALLQRGWFQPVAWWNSPFVTILSMLLAVALLFLAFNTSNRQRWFAWLERALPWLKKPPRRRAVLGLLGVMFLLSAAGGYYAAAQSSEGPKGYDLYALVLPDQAAQAAAGSTPPATAPSIVWWAPRAAPPLPDGLLPMFLGGLIAAGFGLWYPKISGQDADGALGTAEKLIAPLLSAALVAVGAGQQAEATKAKANLQATLQNQPPVIRTVRGGTDIHVVKPSDVNDETAALLKARLDEQQLEIALQHAQRLADNQTLSAGQVELVRQLGELSKRLETLPRTTTVVDAKPDVTAINTALVKLSADNGALANRLKAAMDEAQVERAENCRQATLAPETRTAKLKAAETLDTQATEVEATMSRPQPDRAAAAVKRWFRTGVAQGDPARLRGEAERLRAEVANLDRQRAAYCVKPPGAPTKSTEIAANGR